MTNPDQRWENQLRRIERLTDVVFAVILVRIFLLLRSTDTRHTAFALARIVARVAQRRVNA